METKLNKLIKLYHKKEYRKAISIANSFHSLGEHRDIIKIAHDCYNHPNMYRQMGYDIDECIQAGIHALKEKYSIS